MKKLISLVLALCMVLLCVGAAVAADDKVTITVNRDSTFNGTATEAGRAYTWYKIFSATYETSISTNASGYATDGTANVNAGGTKGISYIATADVAAKLAGDGNKWFNLANIAGSTNKVVSWKDDVTANAANLQAAAAWLISEGAYEDTGRMTFNGDADSPAWTASVDKGYYVIDGDVGDNLIAATTDITVNEKNDYPPLDKTQADEDAVAQTNDGVDVAVGDTITYEVKVTIPKTAAVGNTIDVWDIPSDGLDYQNDVAVKTGSNTGNATITDGTLGTDEIWHKVITVVAGSQGTDVVFTFTCKITEDALVDAGRVNTAQLKYGNNYESKPDTVTYTTYFTGIHKIDESTPAVGLKGVKFALKEAGTAFNVTAVKKGGTDEDKDDVLYYIPGGSSNEVITNDNGYIYIRGLDNDKTYTLTETETLPGFNPLDKDVTLSLVEDKGDAFEKYDADAYQDVINRKGTVLPSTGGIGTTIFYILGGLLVIGAAVILVARRKASN